MRPPLKFGAALCCQLPPHPARRPPTRQTRASLTSLKRDANCLGAVNVRLMQLHRILSTFLMGRLAQYVEFVLMSCSSTRPSYRRWITSIGTHIAKFISAELRLILPGSVRDCELNSTWLLVSASYISQDNDSAYGPWSHQVELFTWWSAQKQIWSLNCSSHVRPLG